MCLAGNHDLVVRGDIDVRYFAMSAGDAARWTVKVVNATTRDFLAGLAPLGQSEGVGLYHASPRDPVWEYVLSVSQAAECLEVQHQRVCLIGHSHVACYFSPQRRRHDRRAGARRRRGRPEAEGEWLVNPGSVGQPRDGDPRAVVPAAGHRPLDRGVPARRVPDRRGRQGDRATPASRARWPTACTRATEPLHSGNAVPIRRRRRTLCAAAALVCGRLVAGCGDEGSNELSSSTASSLRSDLDQIEQSVDGGDCTTAGAAGGGSSRARSTRFPRVWTRSCGTRSPSSAEPPGDAGRRPVPGRGAGGAVRDPTVTDARRSSPSRGGPGRPAGAGQEGQEAQEGEARRIRDEIRDRPPDTGGSRTRKCRLPMATRGDGSGRAADRDGVLGSRDRGPLPARRAARRGRHVDRLPRARQRARAAGRGEAPGRAPRRGRRLRGALPARGAGRREARAPQHRAGLRLRARRGRAPALHRHGVRRGPTVGQMLRERGRLPVARGGRHRRRRPARGSSTRTATASSTAT